MNEPTINIDTLEGRKEYERILIEREGFIRCAHCLNLTLPDDNYCMYCGTPGARRLLTGTVASSRTRSQHQQEADAGSPLQSARHFQRISDILPQQQEL